MDLCTQATWRDWPCRRFVLHTLTERRRRTCFGSFAFLIIFCSGFLQKSAALPAGPPHPATGPGGHFHQHSASWRFWQSQLGSGGQRGHRVDGMFLGMWRLGLDGPDLTPWWHQPHKRRVGWRGQQAAQPRGRMRPAGRFCSTDTSSHCKQFILQSLMAGIRFSVRYHVHQLCKNKDA